MISQISKIANSRKYSLVHNGERKEIKLERIKGLRDFIRKVSRTPEFKEEEGYFIYNEYNFASWGISEKIDLVFVDWDGKVTKVEESFDMNKISSKIDRTKFIYIFKKNTIKKNKILTNDTLGHEYVREKGKGGISLFDLF